jgi:hypothetical protein
VEKTNVNPQESTVANADLWTKYFRDEWSRYVPRASAEDSPLAAVAESTAAQVAGFLTLVAAGPIAWLYSANAPSVTQIEHRSSDPVAITPVHEPIAEPWETLAEAAVGADTAA